MVPDETTLGSGLKSDILKPLSILYTMKVYSKEEGKKRGRHQKKGEGDSRRQDSAGAGPSNYDSLNSGLFGGLPRELKIVLS